MAFAPSSWNSEYEVELRSADNCPPPTAIAGECYENIIRHYWHKLRGIAIIDDLFRGLLHGNICVCGALFFGRHTGRTGCSFHCGRDAFVPLICQHGKGGRGQGRCRMMVSSGTPTCLSCRLVARMEFNRSLGPSLFPLGRFSSRMVAGGHLHQIPRQPHFVSNSPIFHLTTPAHLKHCLPRLPYGVQYIQATLRYSRRTDTRSNYYMDYETI